MRRLEALAAAAGLLLLAIADRSAAQSARAKAGQPMNQQAVIDLVTLPDGQYFTVTPERLRALSAKLSPPVEELDRGTVTPILVIASPRILDLQTVRRVPILIARRSDGKRNWMVDPEQNFTWLLTSIDDGVTKAVSPQSLDKRRMATPTPSRSGAPPSAEDAEIINYGVERVYLPALFGPKWPQGRYAVTLVAYDRISNTARFETKPLPKVRPELNLLATASVQANPAALPPAAAPASTLTIGAANRLDVVISLSEADTALAKSSDPAVKHPLVPVSLVLLKLDSAVPVKFDLALPAAVANGRVATRVALNLRDLPGGHALSGEYQVYLCAGATVAGPQTLTLP